MSLLEKLVPREASNDYRGSRIAVYAFCVFLAVMLFRSLVHFLKDDSGVNSIATIITFPGSPDPNTVIYMFSSLWGTQQLITVFIYAVVLLCYRNLLPLVYLMLILEVGFRMVVGTIHLLGEEYYARTPPGKLINIPSLVIFAFMLFISLRSSGVERAGGDAGSPIGV